MIRNTMMYLKALVNNKKGQGMIEYGLLAALISIAAIAAILLIGPQLVIIFNNVVTALT